MDRTATITGPDSLGYYLIKGLGIVTALHHMPSLTMDPAGAWVHKDYKDEARERLLAAGYRMGAPDRAQRGATVANDVPPLGEWTAHDQRVSHEGWRLATRALGHDPDAIERTWPEVRERPKVFRRG